MDPVSVVSLVAACSSLVKTCAGVVKTLHSLVETNKFAELSIISISEECETVQLAWQHIENWGSRNLQIVDKHEQIMERLQRSIYCGKLVMSALQEDLAKVVDKKSNFRRGIGLTWYESLFNDHQTRIRGQITSLQLLLQVINLPRNEDRVEMLSVKEHVFKEVDESARSIVPSRLSSRLSWISMDGASTRSVKSVKSVLLNYIPFSFENDLFTSFVYKRNYRVPVTNKRSPRNGSSESDDLTILPSTYLKQSVPPDVLVQNLSLQNGIDINDEGDIKSGEHKRLIEHLQCCEYEEALRCLYHGADIIFIFHHSSGIDSSLFFHLFWHIYRVNPNYFILLMERIAYSAGTSWIKHFKSHFLQELFSTTTKEDLMWNSVDQAARMRDMARDQSDDPADRHTALQLATANSNDDVTSYLLHAGFDGLGFNSPSMIFAVIRLSSEKPTYPFPIQPAVVLNNALLALVTEKSPSHRWCTNSGKPMRWSTQDVFYVLLRHGADPSILVQYRQSHVPLTHRIIYAIHFEDTPFHGGMTMLSLLINAGADPDALGDLPLGSDSPKISITPLALAALCGEAKILECLLAHDALTFWSSSVDVFDHTSTWMDDSMFQMITDVLLSHRKLSLDSFVQESLKRMQIALGKKPKGLKSVILGEATADESLFTTENWRASKPHEFSENHSNLTPYILWSGYQGPDDPLRGRIDIPKRLTLTRGSKECKKDSSMTPNSIQFVRHLQNGDFKSALVCLRHGADVITAFQISPAPETILFVDFLWYLYCVEKSLCRTIMERIAFAAGTVEIRTLQSYLLERHLQYAMGLQLGELQTLIPPEELQYPPLFGIWHYIYNAAKYSDIFPYGDYSSLYVACAADNYDVVEPLLRAGYDLKDDLHLAVVLAASNCSTRVLELLASDYLIQRETLAWALERLIDNIVNSRRSLTSFLNTELRFRLSVTSIQSTLRILLRNYTPTDIPIFDKNYTSPLLHFAISSPLASLEMASILIEYDANINELREIEDPRLKPARVYISPLALAAFLGKAEVVKVLLEKGATSFRSSEPGVYGNLCHLTELNSLKNVVGLLQQYETALELFDRSFVQCFIKGAESLLHSSWKAQ
ncbi:hypothetical protein CC78DRAFT_581975 [Lojkania enalia]|uniref:Ankyrin n=1 Tax=Lojkania enalia TaxID=147567 RepID=A0A9P4KBM3_9PLEO|nr:hypothetical protein CC78DRAFT_581975 [Didymosphaeria enalia]